MLNYRDIIIAIVCLAGRGLKWLFFHFYGIFFGGLSFRHFLIWIVETVTLPISLLLSLANFLQLFLWLVDLAVMRCNGEPWKDKAWPLLGNLDAFSFTQLFLRLLVNYIRRAGLKLVRLAFRTVESWLGTTGSQDRDGDQGGRYDRPTLPL